jgi:hypothetical protein
MFILVIQITKAVHVSKRYSLDIILATIMISLVKQTGNFKCWQPLFVCVCVIVKALKKRIKQILKDKVSMAYSLRIGFRSRLGQRHGLQNTTLISCFYKKYLWKSDICILL